MQLQHTQFFIAEKMGSTVELEPKCNCWLSEILCQGGGLRDIWFKSYRGYDVVIDLQVVGSRIR